MFGKLIKYDLRSCLRRFGPLWITAAALSVLTGLSFRFVLDAPGEQSGIVRFLLGVLPVMLLVGLMAAIAILALVFVCERFYRGLLGEEGYLMHTLPASAGAHIASKGLTALILELISGLVALISGFLLVTVYQPAGFAEGWQVFMQELRSLDIPAAVPWIFAECLLLMLVMAAVQTLKIYSAIALGHLARSHRILWAVVAYIGIGIVLNTLLAAAARNGLLFRLLGGGSWGLSFINDQLAFNGAGAAAASIGTAILGELLLGAVFFFLTRFILQKRLNLE